MCRRTQLLSAFAVVVALESHTIAGEFQRFAPIRHQPSVVDVSGSATGNRMLVHKSTFPDVVARFHQVTIRNRIAAVLDDYNVCDHCRRWLWAAPDRPERMAMNISARAVRAGLKP
jgi:hypothetical protein